MGRPRRKPDGRVAITARINPDTHDRLRAAAEQRVVSAALIIEAALSQWLDAHPALGLRLAAVTPACCGAANPERALDLCAFLPGHEGPHTWEPWAPPITGEEPWGVVLDRGEGWGRPALFTRFPSGRYANEQCTEEFASWRDLALQAAAGGWRYDTVVAP